MASKIEIEMLNEIIVLAEQGKLTVEQKDALKFNLACKIESTRNIVIKSKSRYILSMI